MSNIKLLMLDVDGTLTDGKIYISNSGEEIKAFNVKDGYAIKEILPKTGIVPVIITGRKSKIVEIRANELDIKEVYQGVKSKLQIYEDLKSKYNITDENIAYIGDDFNDLIILKRIKYSACPQDAVEKVKEVCNFIMDRKGGEGAVYEFIIKLFCLVKGNEFIL
jgi:3-deoxy-D-manno-octulosonate 8-phosphate phosphatase (KDO 8-P phosphatase)